MEIPQAPDAQAPHALASDASRARVLFRPEALAYYQQRHEAAVVPQFISGGRSAVLWLLAALLLAGVTGVGYALRGLWPGL
jgi:hypothetical protein